MNIATIYLGINSLLYFIFALWCAFFPDFTSQAVGLSPVGDKGMAEYTAVYGGLEFSLGLFFLFCAISQKYTEVGMLFSVFLYVSLALFRSYALISRGAQIENGWVFYSLECFFAISGLIIFRRL